jgi:2,4-dienoyl-CoA reductase (NADPH2)
MGGIGFDTALYLLERESRAPLDPGAFREHWGISTEGRIIETAAKTPVHRITMLKRSHTPFGHTLGRTTGWVHRAELARNGVRMLKGVEYRKIDDQGIHLSIDGKELLLAADTIILCAGQVPRNELKGTHVIGGAKEATELDAKRAMLEGAELGAML